ncbi:MAG: GTP-binding protein [Candidatus Heimdallarchaeota archaeon]|nr:GTP-binding protein [Candidatus Heimdallarchaeota archaeon]
MGKTTLRLRYIGEGFRKEYITTMGADFALATHGEYVLQIWDLAGQETFELLTKRFYKGAQGVIIVFDITYRESMNHIENWIDKFIENEGRLVPLVIFGNKIDLRASTENHITQEEGMNHLNNLSKKYETDIIYIETSALTGENIDFAFENLVNLIADN